MEAHILARTWMGIHTPIMSKYLDYNVTYHSVISWKSAYPVSVNIKQSDMPVVQRNSNYTLVRGYRQSERKKTVP